MSEQWAMVLIAALGCVLTVVLGKRLDGYESPRKRRRRERWEFASEKLSAFSDAHATSRHSHQYLVTTKFEDSRESTVANSWCNTCGAAEIVVVTDKDVADEQARRAVVA